MFFSFQTELQLTITLNR